MYQSLYLRKEQFVQQISITTALRCDASQASTAGRWTHFEAVNAMRVRDGKTTNHWGVGNLYSLVPAAQR
jgi:hypothetical protein